MWSSGRTSMAEDYVQQIESARRLVEESQALIRRARELMRRSRAIRAEVARLRDVRLGGSDDPAFAAEIPDGPSLSALASVHEVAARGQPDSDIYNCYLKIGISHRRTPIRRLQREPDLHQIRRVCHLPIRTLD